MISDNDLRTTLKSFNFQERSPTRTIPKNLVIFSFATNFFESHIVLKLAIGIKFFESKFNQRSYLPNSKI